MRNMKFSVFADFHYNPGVFYKGTWEDMDFILKRAEVQNVDFIIHVGDLCHGPSTVPEFIEHYNNFKILTYHCLGNHDTDKTSYAETLKMYHMEDGHYYFDNNGYRFIVCDTNYLLLDGAYIHFDVGNYYKNGDARDHMPPEQLEWLEQTIADSEYPCILLNHSSFERRMGGTNSQDKIQTIIRNANKRKAHSVLMCINGHHHRDNIRILDNVVYFDLNSTSFDWLSQNPHDLFPEEITKAARNAPKTVMYSDPIHAIITLEGTTITIDGMESEMFMGVRREDTNNDICDKDGRPVVPRVQSAKITLG